MSAGLYEGANDTEPFTRSLKRYPQRLSTFVGSRTLSEFDYAWNKWRGSDVST
jgi:hypothetical protein